MNDDLRVLVRYLTLKNVVKTVGVLCFSVVSIAVTVFIIVQLWQHS